MEKSLSITAFRKDAPVMSTSSQFPETIVFPSVTPLILLFDVLFGLIVGSPIHLSKLDSSIFQPSKFPSIHIFSKLQLRATLLIMFFVAKTILLSLIISSELYEVLSVLIHRFSYVKSLKSKYLYNFFVSESTINVDTCFSSSFIFFFVFSINNSSSNSLGTLSFPSKSSKIFINI